MLCMKIWILYYVAIVINIGLSKQDCSEESTGFGIKVTWPDSSASNNVKSDPLCFFNETLITRNCTNSGWIPNAKQLQSCDKAVKYFNSLTCPPGFNKISESNNKYCYQIGETSSWNDPCFGSGGATVITDLTNNETESLIASLKPSKYTKYWLPARRQKIFAPVVWHIPGPNWGQTIAVHEHLSFRPSLLKNCLLLDPETKTLKTEVCNMEYPSLCFYINEFNHPAKCPEGYYAFRHMLDNGRCYGIESTESALTFQEFFNDKCKTPMGDGENIDLRKFIFTKVAQLHNTSDSLWCWFSSTTENIRKVESSVHSNISIEKIIEEEQISNFKNVINSVGTIGLMNSSNSLPCMACEADIIYGETELFFEYNALNNKIYLTVYFPSGLWKYSENDKGVQCFSDAKGFFKVIDIFERMPLASFRSLKSDLTSDNLVVEKSIFEINLVTDRSASYWCEGHTKNFSLVTTEKIVVNPQGREFHVFSLILEMYVRLDELDNATQFDSSELLENLNKILLVEKVILMDVLNYENNIMQILFHVHIYIKKTFNMDALNLLSTYNALLQQIKMEFPTYSYTFVNMSSSVYCLPTVSYDTIPLYWDLTPIGNIAAPKQFCLQSNGVPVNRHCYGSYLIGSMWGPIIGQCDKSYQPSLTTTMLFNFIQGNLGNEFHSRFLTTGLPKVLSNTDIIIPADIYYISVSFRQILSLACQNESFIETGDINNLAWAIDRIMAINENNLRLAQTMNSTNVILDSVNDIIGMITRQSTNLTTESKIIKKDKTFQLAVKPKFIVQISYPGVNNITGLAVIKLSSSDKFDEMKIEPLYKNTTFDDIVFIKDLEVAAWLPEDALKNLESNTNSDENMHIVINVYYDDVIFQQLTKHHYKINSRIIEVAVPGYAIGSEFSLPILFRDVKHTSINAKFKKCGFWDFQRETGSIPGIWSGRGCAMVTKIYNVTICECYHLTHFGQLININGNTGSDESIIVTGHKKALNIITLIGSSLSLMGIIGIWITAIVFDMWRKKTGTKVLLQLSTAIALPLILIILFNVDSSLVIQIHEITESTYHIKVICVILGAFFHYSVLTNFMWMLITAILQFFRYVRVLGVSRPSKFMVKIALLGWGLPSVPVIIVLLIDRENYLPRPDSQRSICYPSGIYMMLGVVLPVCIILIINVVLFILVIKAISRKSDMRATDKSLVCAQFRLSIFLFFLLGLTWIFGIMSFSGSIICSYIFCLTSTVQGFVLFIYFIICDPTTRNLWVTVMKPQFSSSRNSITTISSG